MTDTTLNRYVAQGNNAERAAFTPVPGTPASGPDFLNLFWDTDDEILYYWDGAAWAVTSTSGGTVDNNAFSARLSALTGVAVPTTDVTAATSVYLIPYGGELIALYNGSIWEYHNLDAEISLALTGLIKGVCYDIYVYDVAGTLTLEAVAWKNVVAGNNPAAGSSVTINLADTSTLVVGMDVTVRDGSASEIARITTVTASTSIVVDTLANSYTAPNICGYRTRATELATQDGVYCKTGDLPKRYVGTIAITATTAQTEDSVANRLVWNYYNRKPRSMSVVEGTNSWTYSTAAFRQANASKVNQLVCVIGVLEDEVSIRANSLSGTNTGTNRTRSTGVGQNRVLTNDAQLIGCISANNTQSIGVVAFYEGMPPIGRNYFAWLEKGGGADTQTWFGDNGDVTSVSNGISGRVLA